MKTYRGALSVRVALVGSGSSRHTISDDWLRIRTEIIGCVIRIVNSGFYTAVESGLSDVRREEGRIHA